MTPENLSLFSSLSSPTAKCWSYLWTESNIYQLSLYDYTNITDPTSMQDTCHT